MFDERCTATPTPGKERTDGSVVQSKFSDEWIDDVFFFFTCAIAVYACVVNSGTKFECCGSYDQP